MIAVGSKLKRDGDALLFNCPGCRHWHVVSLVGPGPMWAWNGSGDAPTFTPSILVTSGHHVRGQPQPPDCRYCNNGAEDDESYCGICHSFVTDGRIQFLGDCTHALAGQTVDLPDWETRHGS